MRTITIPTTQNVSIEYELAGSLIRVFALSIDALIFLGVYLLLVNFFGLFFGYLFTVAYLPTSLFLLYYFCSELFFNGQTIGKRTQGIKVIRVDGRQPTPGDYLLRALFLLPEVWFTLGIPAVLLVNTTPRGQRLGDLAAHTVVIRVNASQNFGLADILNIKTTNNYDPRFLEVQQLNEEDMLIVKQTLTRAQQYRNPAHQQAVNELADRIRSELDLTTEAQDLDSSEFLRQLLRDYIVLTR